MAERSRPCPIIAAMALFLLTHELASEHTHARTYFFVFAHQSDEHPDGHVRDLLLRFHEAFEWLVSFFTRTPCAIAPPLLNMR